MTHSRTVRVFLSSTFRDFAEETDLLVRKLVQSAFRQRRLKSAGSGNEQNLVAETGRLHHELQESFAYSTNIA